MTVTVNRIRHALAASLGWGDPGDPTLALSLAGALHAPEPRAPEVAATEHVRKPTRRTHGKRSRAVRG
ncbi:hypothetical protein [Streptomyces sp. NBC_01304]|uniref:hypothetical protein n=1 Tax=Streptomyces sp. NBC_01304 TaxID=2903818 RepID=UPI002E135312|nr:hypothetical protein OG430_26820 [Streptomyces sp. NBC_01304]